jgi:hypothetical protein
VRWTCPPVSAVVSPARSCHHLFLCQPHGNYRRSVGVEVERRREVWRGDLGNLALHSQEEASLLMFDVRFGPRSPAAEQVESVRPRRGPQSLLLSMPAGTLLRGQECCFGPKGEGAWGAAIGGQRRRGSLLVSMRCDTLDGPPEVGAEPPQLVIACAHAPLARPRRQPRIRRRAGLSPMLRSPAHRQQEQAGACRLIANDRVEVVGRGDVGLALAKDQKQRPGRPLGWPLLSRASSGDELGGCPGARRTLR